jgi:hypothetical protein
MASFLFALLAYLLRGPIWDFLAVVATAVVLGTVLVRVQNDIERHRARHRSTAARGIKPD